MGGAEFLAQLYMALAALMALFQLALAYGAPWGNWTLGGRFPGRLPLPVRFGALLQSALLLAMGASVLARAGLLTDWPGWTFWPALALTGVTFLGNLTTASAPERRLWAPVSGAMVLAAIAVGFAG